MIAVVCDVQSFVTAKLSQKLRHVRWLRNIRADKHALSASQCEDSQQKKKRKICTLSVEEQSTGMYHFYLHVTYLWYAILVFKFTSLVLDS